MPHLYLSEDYQVAVPAGTALGGGGARWNTIQLQRGDMLLMVATSRHHGLPALPDSKDGLQGELFNLWTPDRAHKHHQPNTTHLDPSPPNEALDIAGDLSSWDFPSVDQVLWVGKGAVGRVGLWEGDAAQALFADPPESVPVGPPTGRSTPPSSAGRPRPPTSPSPRSASSACCSSWAACTS